MINAFNHKSFYSFHLKFAVSLEQNMGGGGGGVLRKSRKHSALVIFLLNRIPVFIQSSRIIHSYLNTYIERKARRKRSNIYAKFMHNT